MAKPCDSCNTAPAAVFCGAHSAFLCPICDADLHAPPTRHPRVVLCEQSPAAVTCKADAAVLCSACDADIHAANPLARRHHRLPVLPFYHAASAEDFSDEEVEAASWILPDPNSKQDLDSGSPCGANPGRAERKQASTDGVVPGEDNREYESGQYPGRITDGFPAFDLEYSGSKPFMYNFTTSQSINQSMAFLISFTQIAEVEWSSIYDMFKFDFNKMFIGTLSLPINLPGSNYYQGLKCRRNVTKNLKQLMKNRRASPERHDDMLGHLLIDEKNALNDEEIIDQIITILNSGYETVSTTSMMAIKYLHDNPEALQELRNEHFAIQRRKEATGEQLDWDDYKSMRFTRAVIFETMRLATVVNGVLRKTTQDLQLNEFLVPKGWRIYVYTREIYYDPIIYPEPMKFNPWRWMDDKKLESHNYCLLFGGGLRMCPGKELGIVKVSIFLHYFVTTYRREEVGGEKILQFPRVLSPTGYHIRVMKL